MFSLPGQFIGDPWFFVAGDTVHMWFLCMPASLGFDQRWRHWDIGHAVSRDLRTWEYRGLALTRGWGDAWDSQKLATGSVMFHDGLYWMAYTGHRRHWLNVQRAGMAWSTDLETWHKLAENPVSEACVPWYHLGRREGADNWCSWRDPFLVADGPWIYQLITAMQAGGDNRSDGAIARCRSRDMRRWEVLEPLDVQPVGELECPQIHQLGGRWYLTFSTGGRMVRDGMRRQQPGHDFRMATRSMVADDRWGPYRMVGDGMIQPDGLDAYLYAGQIVDWQGRHHLLGFAFGRDGRPSEAIMDPIEVVATPAGLKQV